MPMTWPMPRPRAQTHGPPDLGRMGLGSEPWHGLGTCHTKIGASQKKREAKKESKARLENQDVSEVLTAFTEEAVDPFHARLDKVLGAPQVAAANVASSGSGDVEEMKGEHAVAALETTLKQFSKMPNSTRGNLSTIAGICCEISTLCANLLTIDSHKGLRNRRMATMYCHSD